MSSEKPVLINRSVKNWICNLKYDKSSYISKFATSTIPYYLTIWKQKENINSDSYNHLWIDIKPYFLYLSNTVPCRFQIPNRFLYIMWMVYSMNLVCLVWWYKLMLTLTFPCRIQKKHHHSLNLLYYHPSVVVSFYPQFCLFLLKLMDNILQKQQNSFVLLSSFLNFVQIFCVQMCDKIYKNVC